MIPLPPVRDVPEIADSVPMPPARPPGLGAETPVAPSVASAPPAQSDNGNIFQKLLGSLTPPSRPVAPPPVAPPVIPPPVVASLAPPPPVAPPRAVAVPPPEAAPAVASAAPEARGSSGRGGPSPMFPFFEKIFGRSAPPAGYDQYTAVYDISAKVLYMPDGSRIEAHSGLGPMLDDPRYVHERARGATPPHLYELTMREALFHGVQAIRLNPVGGEGGIYGRAGLLAHPYMLGPNGDFERLRIGEGLRRLPARLPERPDQAPRCRREPLSGGRFSGVVVGDDVKAFARSGGSMVSSLRLALTLGGREAAVFVTDAAQPHHRFYPRFLS